MDSETRRSERLIALFLFGAVAFSPLVLRVFDSDPPSTLFGIPVLVLFVFAAWAVLVGLMALVVERHSSSRGDDGGAAEAPRAERP
jgi:hypothetical protein